jgi:hypothetical protein
VVTSMPHRRCGFLDRTDEALDFGRPDLVVETITFALHNTHLPQHRGGRSQHHGHQNRQRELPRRSRRA